MPNATTKAAISALILLGAPADAVSTTDGTMPQRLLSEIVSTSKNELNFQLIDNEATAVFTRANADYTFGKIYLATMAGTQAVDLGTIGFSDARYKDSDPWLSPSGTELYFISDRPAFLGDIRKSHSDYDIWRSRKSGNDWLAPEHLGPVSSLSGEFGPEVNNGYLYFSSRKSGRYDIYRSLIKPDGFGPPELLPAPFNTTSDDSDFTLTKDGRVALWWSRRPGGHGSGDLYVSRLIDDRWTAAENLGPAVNSADLDFTPSLSPNNAVLYFATNKPFPGQEKGAADVYKIPVKNLPVLRKAISENALEKLKAAFGGNDVLSEIRSISTSMETTGEKSATKKRDIYLDFDRGAIAELSHETGSIKFANQDHGLQVNGETKTALSSSMMADLLTTMTANFLYYLTADDLELLGPEDVRGHGDLAWFHMRTRDTISPLVGLDPMTGRIVKVLGEGGYVVRELDYLKDEAGLIWPYRFIVERNGKHILTGSFSSMTINPTPPAQAPDWFLN